MKKNRIAWRAGTAVLFVSLLTACGSGSSPGAAGGQTGGSNPGAEQRAYDADIRYTSFGIPHITADDTGSLGYGMGYAFATDNTCELMKDIITVRGERSKYFGETGTYLLEANQALASNLDSDFFWKHVVTDAAIARLLTPQSEEFLETMRGYKSGFNRYVRELQSGGHTGRHPECRDEAWLFELSDQDMARRFIRLAILASSSVFVEGIATAQPPVPGTATAASARSTSAGSDSASEQKSVATIANALVEANFPLAKPLKIGSNTYALGPDATDTGQPMVLINPHFPWVGPERFWMSHLTLPGELDIMGGALHGAPAILIGWNDNLAWSHTVSEARRFSFYELNLDPSNATRYLKDGVSTAMTAHQITVELQGGGTATRTLYDSEYGPMLVFAGVLNWTTAQAYALRDVNLENLGLLQAFIDWNRATSLAEFQQIQRHNVAIPWVNTSASGPNGRAWYSDLSRVPNVPDSMLTQCSSSLVAQAVRQVSRGVHTLDGSQSACAWMIDPAAPQDGIFSAANLPELERDDWIHNCNDTYWLTNPDEPLTGFDSIIGDEDTVRSLRTRLCILQVQRRLDGSDGRSGNKFTLEQLKDTVLASDVQSAALLRDGVVAQACTPSTVTVADPNNPGGTNVVDISEACSVLAAWDLTNNIDSVGGHIWRELFSRASESAQLYLNQFNSNDPVNTPNTLNPAAVNDVRTALAQAVQTLEGFNIPLDTTLGELQYALASDGSRIPIFGGLIANGVFTALGDRLVTAEGYGPPDYGNSIIGIATWDEGGVLVDGFLTYSQSSDPTSPHFDDITRRYSEKDWIRWPFHEDEIQADLQREFSLFEIRP